MKFLYRGHSCKHCAIYNFVKVLIDENEEILNLLLFK